MLLHLTWPKLQQLRHDQHDKRVRITSSRAIPKPIATQSEQWVDLTCGKQCGMPPEIGFEPSNFASGRQ
jgi:hypothetical protein